MGETIEDIILDQDKRGMLALRPHLPDDYCSQAAQFIMDHPGHVIIVTGFYVVMAGKPETDGPPGALAIGEALTHLGRTITDVSDSPGSAAQRPAGRDALGATLQSPRTASQETLAKTAL